MAPTARKIRVNVITGRYFEFQENVFFKNSEK
jgi:hypothetical protein